MDLLESGDKNIPMITLNDADIIYPQNDPSAGVNLDEKEHGNDENNEENGKNDRLLSNTNDN